MEEFQRQGPGPSDSDLDIEYTPTGFRIALSSTSWTKAILFLLMAALVGIAAISAYGEVSSGHSIPIREVIGAIFGLVVLFRNGLDIFGRIRIELDYPALFEYGSPRSFWHRQNFDFTTIRGVSVGTTPDKRDTAILVWFRDTYQTRASDGPAMLGVGVKADKLRAIAWVINSKLSEWHQLTV